MCPPHVVEGPPSFTGFSFEVKPLVFKWEEHCFRSQRPGFQSQWFSLLHQTSASFSVNWHSIKKKKKKAVL